MISILEGSFPRPCPDATLSASLTGGLQGRIILAGVATFC